MPAPQVLNLLRRKTLHNHRDVEPCRVVKHLELDGLVLCPEGRKLHAPGFWARLFKRCRNLKDHRAGYIMEVECMWCRWKMDEFERKHPNLAELYVSEPCEDRPDLHLYAPTVQQLLEDPLQKAFMDATKAQLAAEA